MKKYRTILLALGVASLALVTFAVVTHPAQSPAVGSPARPRAPYVNPGAAHMIQADVDWFSRGTAQTTSLAQGVAQAALPANALLRPAAAGSTVAMSPTQVIVDPAGFGRPQLSVKYADRVELLIRTSPQPFDPQSLIGLDESATPNSLGQTRLYRAFTVRGIPGVARDAGAKVFAQTGSVDYPALLVWGDPAEKAPPYTIYWLEGDGPVSALADVAASLGPRSTIGVAP